MVLVPRRLPRVLSEYRESSTPFTSLEREVLDLPFLFAQHRIKRVAVTRCCCVAAQLCVGLMGGGGGPMGGLGAGGDVGRPG